MAGCEAVTPFTVAPTYAPARATVYAPPPPTSEWLSLTNGIEQRTLIPEGNLLAQKIVLRLDPQQVTFRAHYRPNAPLTLSEWRQQLPDAQVIVNANFFTQENTVLGMLISDGVRYGTSYSDRGATFYSDTAQTVGLYDNRGSGFISETWVQAVQAFPVLVWDGVQAYRNQQAVRPSRRTVLGIDTSGRVLLMVTPGIGLGLYDLSAFLSQSDLELARAVNLDGGGSTMLWLASASYALPSIDPVPAVLAVYLR